MSLEPFVSVLKSNVSLSVTSFSMILYTTPAPMPNTKTIIIIVPIVYFIIIPPFQQIKNLLNNR